MGNVELSLESLVGLGRSISNSLSGLFPVRLDQHPFHLGLLFIDLFYA